MLKPFVEKEHDTMTRKKRSAREQVVKKLHPSRIRVSPMFTAMLSCILDERWTEPVITKLYETSEGAFLAQHEGHAGADSFLAGVDVQQLRSNLRGVSKTAELTEPEVKWLFRQAAAHISFATKESGEEFTAA